MPVEGFNWVENASQFCKNCVKNYNEDTEEVYFHKADVQYHEKLYNLHTDLPFFTWNNEHWKNWKTCSLHDKKEYIILIRNLKQALNHGLVFKKVHRVIKFNQNPWQKVFIHWYKKH